ncbi:Eco57I restriction-modification methylase domain-containing protein [Virgisporangium aurantiacum]|uniref:site-specific DNA-methyltransferase (adenine-specific) n=1 Tax=Virgisporangium aurantiacum TaxID=175570 RepID=A0A8J4DZZ8_9ACTN|nr:type IIL restriction-modification enzyme MmeI [Virgisporangium aurantiacum]GIJ56098.1 hypothetical protein Vau01_036140 [Virgisporangium aurantiacum]
MKRPYKHAAPDGVQQHRNWLSLVEVSGPFLSLPVLRATWPTLDPLDKKVRERLRVEHATWQDDVSEGQQAWIRYILGDLLGWGELLHEDRLGPLAVHVAEHDTDIVPSFVLVEPDAAVSDLGVKPDAVRLLGMVCPPGAQPTARVAGSAWSATTVDRLAHLCRHHNIELGLATDGRWWAMVWAPRGGVTTTAVFDAVAWPEAAERDVVRAFYSLLNRQRFFGVPENERLVPLLRTSLDSQEEITEALGVQVRQAVELLVTAIGRADVRDRERGEPGLRDVTAHDVYRGAVAVMMRIVFLLFAEERRLLPSDNDLYTAAYSAGRLCDELEQRVIDGSEEDLEHTNHAWLRLIALFNAVYHGIDHPRLVMHGHDGSLFDPDEHAWLPESIDDRTVLHMLRSVQYVVIGSGRSRERRRLSFRTLDVEQIGYVYEGLLSYEGFRAGDVVVGLIGKEGQEDEVPLADLELLRSSTSDIPGLAAALADRHKDSRIGSATALAKKLAPVDGVEREEIRKKLLAVTGGDYPLAERLLPFVGVIRLDLRGLPTVILPGALFVTESPLRKNTGTHYTPRFLAEEVVEGSLEPLVYSPGPLQTADKAEWRPRSSAEVLSLKVADIAMGSAAFLVAAARYLARHLIDAWSREGDERARAFLERAHDHRVGIDEEPLVIEARRQVIEHCLYGVDINPMAVEMAKLSLWLVSMDPQRPFTFLDDRLVAGDSLLGITSLDQLEYMHLDPKRGRELHEDLFGWAASVGPLVHEVADQRRQISAVSHDDPAVALVIKRNLLGAVQAQTERLRFLSDLVVGAALAAGRTGGRDGFYPEAARLANMAMAGHTHDAGETRMRWLATDLVTGAFARETVHWPLVFPEVFEREGFDAVIGNPPFLGGSKISGAFGHAYREMLVNVIGDGVRGIADLIAYFVLRAHDVLNPGGQMGIIATNTLAQGDTREVALDSVTREGAVIRRAIKSRPWPSKSAVLEFCAVWTSRMPLENRANYVLDGGIVPGIRPSLDPVSRVAGNAHRLSTNAGRSFIGSYLLGLGFTMSPEMAGLLIEKDSRNSDVLFPYITGHDLNSRPDCSASRWVINFANRNAEQAKAYPDCFEQVLRAVKPDRAESPDRRLREVWWQFKRPAPDLQRAIVGLDHVIAITLVSKVVMPAIIPTGQVFAHKLAVFATDDPALLAVLSGSPHYWWAVSRSSTMKADLNYSPSDVFETLPLPMLTPVLRNLGNRLDRRRREVMLARNAGLTATYNLVFDSTNNDDDVAELRRIHEDIDVAVCEAYGWHDLVKPGLDHGFHKSGPYTRYTVGPAVQREMVDRLLELNHQRYAEEVAQGLHDKKGRKAAKSKASKSEPENSDQETMF